MRKKSNYYIAISTGSLWLFLTHSQSKSFSSHLSLSQISISLSLSLNCLFLSIRSFSIVFPPNATSTYNVTLAVIYSTLLEAIDKFCCGITDCLVCITWNLRMVFHGKYNCHHRRYYCYLFADVVVVLCTLRMKFIERAYKIVRPFHYTCTI